MIAAASGEVSPSVAHVPRLHAATAERDRSDPDALLAGFAGYDDGQPMAALVRIEQFLRSESPPGRAAFEPKLVALLEEPAITPAARRILAGWLRWVGSARAVPALERLAASTELAASTSIAALADIPDPSAETALLRLLATAPESSRVTVINALGQRRAAAALAPLGRTADSANPALATAALEALVRLRTTESFSTLEKLYAANPGSQPRGRALLEAAGERLRQPPAQVIAPARAQALAAIAAVLDSSAATPLRTEAAGILIAADPARAGERLIPLLNGGDVSLARHIARQLVLSGQPHDLSTLLMGFARLPVPIQQALADAAGARAKPDALPLARAAFGSTDSAVRATAALAVGRCGDESAVAWLVPLLTADPALASSGRQALGLLPSGPTDERLRDEFHAAAEPAMRASLLGVLADRQDYTVWPLAAALCAASDARLRFAALDAVVRLARPGDFAGLLALRARLRPDDDLRGWSQAVVATAASDPRPDDCVLVIQRALAEPGAERQVFLGALASLRCDQAAVVLRGLLFSTDPAVRQETIRVLAAFRGDTAFVLLREAAQRASESDERILSFRGFLHLIAASRQGEPPAPLSSVLEHYRVAWSLALRPEDKAAVLAALRPIKSKPAQELLNELAATATQP